MGSTFLNCDFMREPSDGLDYQDSENFVKMVGCKHDQFDQ